MFPNEIPAYAEDVCLMVRAAESTGFDEQKLLGAQEAIAAALEAEANWAQLGKIEDVTLIRVHNLKPAHHTLVNLLDMPLYFTEVKPFAPLGEDVLNKRLLFARATGYLPFGRDEAIAVKIGSEQNYIFTQVYEVNQEGHPRSLAGFFHHSEKEWSVPKSIKDLDRTMTERRLQDVRGDVLWWDTKFGFNEVQKQRLLQTLSLLEQHLETAQPERTKSGAVITRSFIANGSTEATRHMRPASAGWVSYPTSEDAWYFGVWVNPTTLETLTYAEQDVSHVVCETQEQFKQEMAMMADFYGNRREPCARAYEAGMTVHFYDTLFLMASKNKKEIVFTPSTKVMGDNDKQLAAPTIAAVDLAHPVYQTLQAGAFTLLPIVAFELDMLSPDAYKPFEAYARQSSMGIEFVLQLHDGRNLHTVFGPLKQDA